MTLLEALTDQPLTKKALADKMRCDTRTVELAVQEARLRGIPIISDSDGYRYAQTSEEVFEFYRSLRSRIVSQSRTAAAIKRAAFRMQRREQHVEQGELWAA